MNEIGGNHQKKKNMILTERKSNFQLCLPRRKFRQFNILFIVRCANTLTYAPHCLWHFSNLDMPFPLFPFHASSIKENNGFDLLIQINTRPNETYDFNGLSKAEENKYIKINKRNASWNKQQLAYERNSTVELI